MPQVQVLSGSATSSLETPKAALDEAVSRLSDNRQRFARLSPRAKADLLREVLPRLQAVAERWVRRACDAKGIDFDSPVASEEWLGGPVVTIRNVRLLIESLDAIARSGTPPFGAGVAPRRDGRLEVKVFPAAILDRALFAGFSATHLFPEGVTEGAARARQASFYQQSAPEGGVALVLGAGNVASIPATDTLYKAFVDGEVVLLKMNPVNEYLGPFLEEALQPLIERGFLQVVYGGAEVGAHLVNHDLVTSVHITGSDRTHDAIVWGPPGAEQDRRKEANEPLLTKPITSELGNVTPVVIVPGAYSDAELGFLAQNVASQVANNASFNCNAAKLLVVSAGWPQRKRFLELVQTELDRVPPRRAYYPGARDRYESLLRDRERVWRSSGSRDDALSWTVVPDVDAAREDEKLFQVEPFCSILTETALPSSDPEAFIAEATRFCNDRVWGTLSMSIALPPAIERSAGVQEALDRAIVELRYGTVAINHWSALGYGFITPGWGGHPSATLRDVQSGIGWTHNTFMHEGMDKSVVRGPLIVRPKPPWFSSHRTAHHIGRRLVAIEGQRKLLEIPGILFDAIRG